MLYSIHCMDRPDKLQMRLDNYAAHRAHLDNARTNIVLAGPLVMDDGKTPIGSVFVIDAVDRVQAEAFCHADPFYKLGVWDRSSVEIHPLIKRRGWLSGY